MRLCKKCNEEIPNRVRIDNKLRIINKRKFCLKCSPFGKHNTKQLDKIDLTDKKVVCSGCHRKYIVSRKKGNSSVRCNACYTRERRRKLKEKAIVYKGGKCKFCNYNGCHTSLGFHHKDDSKKEFGIAGNNFSWEKIKKELDKCELVCANCHGEIHEKLISVV